MLSFLHIQNISRARNTDLTGTTLCSGRSDNVKHVHYPDKPFGSRRAGRPFKAAPTMLDTGSESRIGSVDEFEQCFACRTAGRDA